MTPPGSLQSNSISATKADRPRAGHEGAGGYEGEGRADDGDQGEFSSKSL